MLADSTRRSDYDLAPYITVPVQYHRAADDPSVPAADVARFADTLRARGTLMEVFVYQARHGFVASNRTGIFDSAAADLAWSRVLPFLATHAGKPILRRPLAPPFAVR